MSSRKQKWLKVIAVGAAVVLLLWLAGAYLNHKAGKASQNQARPSAVPSVQPAAPSAQSTVTDTTPPAAPVPDVSGTTAASSAAVPTLSANQKTAVSFAVTALSVLSNALFADSGEQQQTIDSMVVPAQRAGLEASYASFAPTQASAFGYSSTQAAAAGANYQVNAQLFKLVEVTHNQAVIDLYVVSQWLSQDQQQFQVPAITIVTLQATADGWLYVGSADPPAGAQPRPKTGLTYAQTVQRFQPYLKGYSNVQTSQ